MLGCNLWLGLSSLEVQESILVDFVLHTRCLAHSVNQIQKRDVPCGHREEPICGWGNAREGINWFLGWRSLVGWQQSDDYSETGSRLPIWKPLSGFAQKRGNLVGTCILELDLRNNDLGEPRTRGALRRSGTAG